MPQPFSAIRPRLARPFGVERFTVTTPIASGNTLVSTELSALALGNIYQGRYALIEDGTNAGAVHVVSAFDADTGTLTLTGPALSADTVAMATVSLFKEVQPETYRETFNSSAGELWPTLSVVTTEDLVVHEGQRKYGVAAGVRTIEGAWLVDRPGAQAYDLNILPNGGFEDWDAGAPDGWSAPLGNVTRVEHPEEPPNNPLVFAGRSTAQVEANTDATFGISSPVAVARGARVAFSVWVYSVVAPMDITIEAVLGETSSSIQASAAHRGTGWELLSVSKTIDAASVGACGVRMRRFTGTGSMYVDEAIAVAGVDEVPDGPLTDVQERYVHVQAGGDALGSSYLSMLDPLPRHRRLRIQGRSPVAAVSSDSDMTLDDSPELELLIGWTQARIARDLAVAPVAEADRERWAERMRYLDRRKMEQLERWSGTGQYTRLRARNPFQDYA